MSGLGETAAKLALQVSKSDTHGLYNRIFLIWFADDETQVKSEYGFVVGMNNGLIKLQLSHDTEGQQPKNEPFWMPVSGLAKMVAFNEQPLRLS